MDDPGEGFGGTLFDPDSLLPLWWLDHELALYEGALYDVVMLEEFGPSLWIVDGPNVPFMSFPYPTRMAVVRLADGGLWIWSPIALNTDLEDAINELGPVRHIVSPNKIHHLFLEQWHSRWPEAKRHAPPGLAARKPEINFDHELADEANPIWNGDLDQVIFRGSFAMEEVVFFHRPSRTAIVGDLVQRHDPERAKGWKGLILRLDGLVGDRGSAPREWRATFLRRRLVRAARDRVLEWKPDRLVIAHGACAREGATSILSNAFSWI